MEKLKVIFDENKIDSSGNHIITCALSLGYQKHFIYGKNCDVENLLMYFAVMMFDEFEVDFPVDTHFWADFIQKFTELTGLKRNVRFGRHNRMRKFSTGLFFSGGSDSLLTRVKLDRMKVNYDIVQFFSQAYPFEEVKEARVVSTNIDNLIFHLKKEVLPFHRLEIMLPIISTYKNVYFGATKEDFLKYNLLNIDLIEWWDIFATHEIFVNSLVKDYSVLGVLKEVKEHRPLLCGISHDDYCYKCEKCLELFIEGADQDINFDRINLIKNMNRKYGIEYINDKQFVQAIINKKWRYKTDTDSINKKRFFEELVKRYG